MSTRIRIRTDALLGLANDAAAELVNEAMEEGVDLAQRLVPIDTGDLQASIGIVKHATPDDLTGAYAADEDYAEHVEFGTERSPAQPYMRPSIDAVERFLR